MNHLVNIVLLAKTSLDTGPEEKGMGVSWAIVIFAVLLGLALTLTPANRKTEFKRSKEE